MICKSISFACGVKCLSTSKGRGRLLLRCALNGQWLITLIESLLSWSDFTGHYSNDALLKVSDGLTKLLSELAHCKFVLHLENFAFLDTTWERPAFRKHELVPCKDLGLMVC